MKEETNEFAWGLPLFCAFDMLGPRQQNGVDAGAIVLRDSDAKGGCSHTLTPEEVTSSLERHYCDQPFFTGITMERIEAERIAELWISSDSGSRWFQARSMSFPLREHTGLFREFASIEPNANGILSFVHRYGNLMHVCPILVWYEEVLSFRLALRIWDLLQAKNTRKLGQHFQWMDFPDDWRRFLAELHRTNRPDGSWDGTIPPGPKEMRTDEYLALLQGKGRFLTIDSHPGLAPDKHPQFPDRHIVAQIPWTFFTQEEFNGLADELDVHLVAKRYLQHTIDDHFSKHSGSTLFWSGNKTLTRKLTPKNLLGAIWLQFEQALAGEKKYRTCDGPGCGKWFELSPAVARADKKFCSDLCRVRAYQDRKKKEKKRRK